MRGTQRKGLSEGGRRAGDAQAAARCSGCAEAISLSRGPPVPSCHCVVSSAPLCSLLCAAGVRCSGRQPRQVAPTRCMAQGKLDARGSASSAHGSALGPRSSDDTILTRAVAHLCSDPQLTQAMSSPAPTAAAAETPEAYLSLALSLAHKAGRALHTSWLIHPNDRPRFATKTSSADVVTETDARCEAIVFEGIRACYPKHHLLGEESHETEGVYPALPVESTAIQWIVDPIDGTNNFVHGLPSVAVSIAVLRGREVIAAVIHRPTLSESVYATAGGGAWRVDVTPPSASSSSASDSSVMGAPTRLRSSTITALSAAAVATEMGYSRSTPLVDLMLAKVRSLLVGGQMQSLRMSGSCCCNLADIASGKLDAYYEGINTRIGPKPWDVAAGSLIVREAGGVVSDPAGQPFSVWNGRVLAAANPAILQAVVERLNEATEQWTSRHPEMREQVEYKAGAGIATTGGSSGNAAAAQSSKL